MHVQRTLGNKDSVGFRIGPGDAASARPTWCWGRSPIRSARTLSDEELDQLEHLLNEEDQYLYAWIIEKEPTPPEFDGPMLARIRTFMREHVAAEVAKGIG